MASTKVRGITIELGADASGLSKALGGVNKEISSTQKQLKDVERLLKLDPTNTELLKQKQELLGKSVEDTKTKLDALKKAQEEVAKTLEETGEGKEQYDALTREIASTEMKLKEAEAAAQSFNATSAKISATAQQISDKFGTVAQKTKALSAAAGGALVGLGGLAIKAAQSADELNTMARNTGVSTEELQKMQYAADLIDVPVDTIVGGLTKLKKNLGGTTTAFEELGVKTKDDVTGSFRSITDIFYDSIEALGKIDDETQRDITAMELFGKSADQLAGVIDDGGAALRSLGEEAANMGLIIPQDQLDKANEFNDAIDRLKAEATGTFAALGTEIAEMLIPYLPTIQDMITQILEKLKSIDPEQLGLAAKFLGVTAAISPISSMISGAAQAFSVLSTAIGAITAPIAAVVAGVGVLGGAFATLWTTNSEFKEKMTGIWDSVSNAFSGFTSGIVERLNKMGFEFESFTDIFKSLWEGFCNFLAPIFESVWNMIAGILEGALDVLTGVFDIFAGLFTGNWEQMWDGIKEIFGGIWKAIKSVFVGAINLFIDGINAMIKLLNKINIGGVGINIPLIPKIGLAKGGVLSSGSVLVGEMGPEILTMQGGQAMVQPLNNGNGGGGSTGVVALLEQYLPYLAQNPSIVMDSGALVGAIAPQMNTTLGTFATRGGYR